MTMTKIALAAFVAAAAIAGPTASALACLPMEQSWRAHVAKLAKAERSPQTRIKKTQVRTWQEELVRHRFH